MKTALFVLLLLWGIPSTYFRSKFRKLVYQTEDWKINLRPLFKKELLALFGNLFPDDKAYLKLRFQYRLYLLIYLLLFLGYKMI
ncbi:MAG: hypothetical protein P8O78_02845 [Flavobacteriaceae bacterium]|jgi:hypothetical protein|nr:hypothetical protein [Flavobacteriaceae bacterium]